MATQNEAHSLSPPLGLHKSAAILQQEARLRLGNSLPHQLPLFSHDGDSDSEPSTPTTSANTTTSNIDASTPTLKVNKLKPLTNSSPSAPKVVMEGDEFHVHPLIYLFAQRVNSAI